MRAAIMQPYFFPYLGYFALIKHSDTFILFDTVQFIRHGWIERNRMLKENEGWLYVSVPLEKHERNTKICDTRIRQSENWKQKMLAQIQHYKKKAPHYRNVIDFLHHAFKFESTSMVKLNQHLLAETCGYLGLSFDGPVFSEMNVQIDEAHAADEWALNICKSIGANAYINPIGGTDFFDKAKYTASGIDLAFQKINLRNYSQGRTSFEAGLSILDVMMFNSPAEILQMLDEVEYL